MTPTRKALRSGVALIQTIGRAACNAEGKVILYADKVTDSMKYAIDDQTAVAPNNMPTTLPNIGWDDHHQRHLSDLSEKIDYLNRHCRRKSGLPLGKKGHSQERAQTQPYELERK